MRKIQNSAPATTRRHLPAAVRYLGACAHDEPLDVTLVLRRRQQMERPIPRTPRVEFAARYGADPADVERMRAFGRQHGMQEQACDMARRTLHWRGSAQSLQQAFGVKLGRYEMSPGGAT
ncbi:MAG TPA: protease pro-enzyme activation domain-containing protein, partial [Rhodanobacteraceae bacterium]|nr:protease pro-enzyme activation domain-containing protein [Rhodanobacteraceae bacterium]